MRFSRWDNKCMPSGLSAMYTWRDHWTALRRSKSVKIVFEVFAIFSVINGAIGFVRGSTLNLEDLQKILKKIPGEPWGWFLGIVCLTLAALLIAVFYETKDIVQRHLHDYEKRTSDAVDLVRKELTKALVDSSKQYEGDIAANTLASNNTIKDLKQQINQLEDSLARTKIQLGRPHVTLTVAEVDFSSHKPPVPWNEGTEFKATCSDRDAYGVYIGHAEIGSMSLHSTGPVEKIPVGESRLLQYTLLYFNPERGEKCVNLEFRGRLKQLLDKELEKAGKDDFEIPICVYYKDAAGNHHTTTMNLIYWTGAECPVFEPSNIKQREQLDFEAALLSQHSTTHAD